MADTLRFNDVLELGEYLAAKGCQSYGLEEGLERFEMEIRVSVGSCNSAADEWEFHTFDWRNNDKQEVTEAIAVVSDLYGEQYDDYFVVLVPTIKKGSVAMRDQWLYSSLTYENGPTRYLIFNDEKERDQFYKWYWEENSDTDLQQMNADNLVELTPQQLVVAHFWEDMDYFEHFLRFMDAVDHLY